LTRSTPCPYTTLFRSTDVAEAEHGRTIGHEREESAGPGVRASHLRFVPDRSADLGHARCVGDREIPLSLQRARELGGQLATFVRGEDLLIEDGGVVVGLCGRGGFGRYRH